LLRSLSDQQLAAGDDLEVLVVDDGSRDDTRGVAGGAWPFTVKYLRQANQGATAARNAGAKESTGEVLVFADDDITFAVDTLRNLAATCVERGCVAVGTLVTATEARSALARMFENTSVTGVWAETGDVELTCAECRTGLLAVRREDFLSLGMFQDPTGGWPNWDDVYFGYRASLRGVPIWQSGAAVGFHWDHSLSDLRACCRRWQRAGESVARLFETCPALEPHLPMFHDKLPITWRRDPARLIARKLARRVASSIPVVAFLEACTWTLERCHVSLAVLSPLYRWIVGAYLYRGLQAGMHARYQPAAAIVSSAGNP
jgi:GT2 family glycosyltransferase